MTKIKWGIIGLGGIAHEFARQFESDAAEIVAVGSRTQEKADDFAKQYNVPKAYGTYEDLSLDEDIDIVYIATPNSYHAENMKLMLKAGKHVFVEKAITMNKAELDETLKIAKEKDLIIAEAMTIYHMPIYKKIKDRIDSGEFGPLKLATAYFGSSQDPDPKNRFFNPDLGGGALYDIGVYALTFVHYFLNSDVNELETIMQPFHTGADEMSTISYSTKAGTLGNVVLSFRARLPKQGLIVCEEAFITIDDYPSASEALITYTDGRTEHIQAGDSSQRLRYEMENITQMLLNGEDQSFIEMTKDVSEIMEQASRKWGMYNVKNS